jgi:hypothetical protein
MISKTYISNQKSLPCTLYTESGPISMREFSYFQYLFIATYTLAYDVLKDNDELLNLNISNLQVSKIEEVIHTIRQRLIHSDNRMIAHYARTNIPENDDIYIMNICRENPTNIVFKGISLILVLAIVISGGKIEISSTSVKAELPPLGHGIFELRKALYKKEIDLNITEQISQKK